MLNKKMSLAQYPPFPVLPTWGISGSCVWPDRHRGDRYIKAGVELKRGIDGIADQMLVGAREMQQPHSF